MSARQMRIHDTSSIGRTCDNAAEGTFCDDTIFSETVNHLLFESSNCQGLFFLLKTT